MPVNSEQSNEILAQKGHFSGVDAQLHAAREGITGRINGQLSEPRNKDESQRALAHFATPTNGDNGTDDEQEKAKDPYKISKREHKEMIEQLRRGELPPLLRESWHIVDPATPEAREFQERIGTLAQKLYKPEPNKAHLPNYELAHHDFGAEPVRFLIADDDEPNAWHVNYSKPHIIVFTKGLFKEQPPRESVKGRKEWGEGLWFVRSPHDFAAVLCHEMTHLKLRTLYGEIPNSKLEEGVAYSLPLAIMREKSEELGLNPERCQDIMKKDGIFETIKSNKDTSKGPFSDLREYMDVHPTAENTYSIATNTLAYLRKEKGDIPAHVQELPRFDPTDRLISVIEQSHHVSYVEGQLAHRPQYRTVSFPERTKIIQSVIEGMKDVYQVRVSDLARELNSLQDAVDIKADQEATDNLANAVLHMGLIHSSEAKRLYSALSNASGEGMKPLGRLRAVDAAIRKFVRTIEEYDGEKTAVVRAAKKLNQVLEAEPLVGSVRGRLLLQAINFSHFTFPNEDEIFDVEDDEDVEDDSENDREDYDDDRDEWDDDTGKYPFLKTHC